MYPHYHNLIYFKNFKKFWSFLNSVKGSRTLIPPLKHEDYLVTDDSVKANTFNQYFHSVFIKEVLSDLPSLHGSLQFKSHLIDSIKFSTQDVFCDLMNLKVGKACGPDCITTQLLQKNAEYISPPLAKLFQLSLSSGKLPCDWVIANNIPV